MRTNIELLSKITALKTNLEKNPNSLDHQGTLINFKKYEVFSMWLTSLEKLCNRLLQLQGHIKVMVLLKLFSEKSLYLQDLGVK